jgi:hypothetical protein
VAIWLALVVLAVSAASAAGAEPQPDAAPEAPAVAPDPVPGATQPAEQPPPLPPAQPQPSATAPAQEPSTPSQRRAQARKPAAKHHHARTKPRPAESGVAAARASSMLRIRALLPGEQTTTDSSSGLFILAAGALLALVLASGSMVSVASRAMKGQLR